MCQVDGRATHGLSRRSSICGHHGSTHACLASAVEPHGQGPGGSARAKHRLTVQGVRLRLVALTCLAPFSTPPIWRFNPARGVPLCPFGASVPLAGRRRYWAASSAPTNRRRTTMNINKIICTGRLTKDPELKALPSGTNVCELRLAVDGMGRAREVGYVNVGVFGNSAEAAAKLPHQGLARRSRRPFGIRRVGQRRNQTPRLHGGGQRRVPHRAPPGRGGAEAGPQEEGAGGSVGREAGPHPRRGVRALYRLSQRTNANANPSCPFAPTVWITVALTRGSAASSS